MADDNEQTLSLGQEFANAFGLPGDSGGDGAGNQAPPIGDDLEGNNDGGPDPLKGLTLDALLKHPDLGPALNAWNDKTTNSRIQAEVTKATAAAKQEGRQELAREEEDRYFEALSKRPEELARELAADPKTAADYARWQERQQSQALDADAVAQQAQVYALATEISTWSETLEGSGLPADVREQLKPENFVHLGAGGVKEWGKAIAKAIAKHEAEQIASKEIDERWEAEKQQRNAELDRQRPGAISTAGGANTPPLPVRTTPTSVLFERAFS